jgi:hypothetical protein
MRRIKRVGGLKMMNLREVDRESRKKKRSVDWRKK